MPMLAVRTTVSAADDVRDAFLDDASRSLAAALGKPETYMMIVFEGGHAMRFAGNAAPAAFLDLRSIGLPADRTGELSRLLCDLVQAHLGVATERCYVNFADIERAMWGWDGHTF